MKKYNKYALQICVFLLIVSGIFNISFLTSIHDTKTEQQNIMWKEHLMRIHFVSYVLEHVAIDMQTNPTPIEHIDSKLKIAINGNRPRTGVIDPEVEIQEVNSENYDLDIITWWIYEELLGIINNEQQLSIDEYKKLANKLNISRDLLEEYWLGVGNENKSKTIMETRSILLDILSEIRESQKNNNDGINKENENREIRSSPIKGTNENLKTKSLD